jgi:predicted ATPase/DNA-binding CsgD family transcriptional regulator
MAKTNHALKKNKLLGPLVNSPYQAKIIPFSKTNPNNLSTPFSSFIGREQELNELTRLLSREAVRLVTLTGMGGIGKTRLSLELANRMLAGFSDGVYFVELASITNVELVPGIIAQTLGLKDPRTSQWSELLKSHLQNKQMLLVLDNFEQVVGAAKLVLELLATAPKVKIVITNREILRLYGEHQYEVPLLELPDTRQMPAFEQLAQNTAVNLFVQRACMVKPDFRLTHENAIAIAELGILLEGLPLAIEIAAVSSRIYTPQALLNRLLVSRLKLPCTQAKNLPERQQSLLATIEWSYELLKSNEKKLFRHLGIFKGGFTVEAVEAVYEDSLWTEDDLLSLVNKSLLRVVENVHSSEPHYILRESIREYALAKLTECGELDSATENFSDYYLALAEKATLELNGLSQVAWLKSLIYEQGNFRAILDVALASGDAETALQIAGGLWQFWWISGQLSEGRRWLEEALALQAGEEDTTSPLDFAMGDLLQLALPKQNEMVKPVAKPSLSELTRREIEVLRLVAQGMTNQEVAQKLVISAGTVNVHLNSIYGKLDVRSRTAAAHFALQHKLI